METKNDVLEQAAELPMVSKLTIEAGITRSTEYQSGTARVSIELAFPQPVDTAEADRLADHYRAWLAGLAAVQAQEGLEQALELKTRGII